LITDAKDSLVALVIGDMPKDMRDSLHIHCAAAFGIKPGADIVYQDSAAAKNPLGQMFTVYHFDVYGRCHTSVRNISFGTAYLAHSL
jgi:hypothetical protein